MPERGTSTSKEILARREAGIEVEAFDDASSRSAARVESSVYLDDREMLAALRKSLNEARAENRRLQQELASARGERLRTPDDLAAAVSHSLDSLQARLSETRNPVSQFAVRELSIEANVHMSISPLGTLEYRFLDLGEEVPAASLSKINMTMVPLPKEDAAASGRVEPTEGIETLVEDPDVRRKLNEHHVYTVADFLRVGTRVRSRMALAAMVDVDRDRLGGWLDQAELMTIQGVGGHGAAVLRDVGVGSVAELAGAEPEELIKRYNSRVERLEGSTLSPADPETVKSWVATAAKAVHRRDPG